MAIFTKSEFFQLTASRTPSFKTIKNVFNEARQSSKADSKTSIFLSHAHSDKAIIEQAVSFFRTLNFVVYVDWMDETMPEKPNGVTGVIGRWGLEMHSNFIRIKFVCFL